MWYFHTVDCYLGLKINGLTYTSTWRNHENTVLSERIQTHIFFLKNSCLFETQISQRQSERQREKIFYLLVQYPNRYNDQSWVLCSWKAEASSGSPIWIWDLRDCILPPLPFQIIGRELDLKWGSQNMNQSPYGMPKSQGHVSMLAPQVSKTGKYSEDKLRVDCSWLG